MSDNTALARTRPCQECTAEQLCNSHGVGCATRVATELLWEFRQDFPEAELIDATPKERVIWRYWDAGYARSFHGEAAIVELGEIN